MSIFYFLFQWLKEIKEEKKAKARAEVRRSPRKKDVKVFYKESSSSEDTKKATIKQRQRQRQWQVKSSLLLMAKGYVDLPHKIFKWHNYRFLRLILGLSFHLLNFIDACLHLLGCEEAYPFVGMGWIPSIFLPCLSGVSLGWLILLLFFRIWTDSFMTHLKIKWLHLSSDMNVHFRLRAQRCQSILGRGTWIWAWHHVFPPLSQLSTPLQAKHGAHVQLQAKHRALNWPNQATQLQGLTFQQVRHLLVLKMQFLQNWSVTRSSSLSRSGKWCCSSYCFLYQFVFNFFLQWRLMCEITFF